MTVSALLVALALACSTDGSPPPQSTPVSGQRDEEARGTRVVPLPDMRVQMVERTPLDDLVRAWPGLAALDAPALEQVGAALDVAPAPCGACGELSITRCGLDRPEACPVLPGLVGRALRVAESGAGFRVVEGAVSYPDEWFSFPPLAAGAAVPVEVWLDVTSPFALPTLEKAEQVARLDEGVGLAFRWLPEEGNSLAHNLALAAIAADAQGMGAAWVRAAQAWRDGQSADPASLPDDPSGEIVPLVAGLDVDRWTRARDGATGRLDADVALARELGVRSLPTWFVAGYRLRGDQSTAAVARLVQLALYDQGRADLPLPGAQPPPEEVGP